MDFVVSVSWWLLCGWPTVSHLWAPDVKVEVNRYTVLLPDCKLQLQVIPVTDQEKLINSWIIHKNTLYHNHVGRIFLYYWFRQENLWLYIIIPVRLHLTPASPALQSWFPIPAWGQELSVCSVPLHITWSRRVSPEPLPKIILTPIIIANGIIVMI